jgi:hypothetical protein
MVGNISRRIMVQASLGIKVTPYSEKKKAKSVEGMIQVIECLASIMH